MIESFQAYALHVTTLQALQKILLSEGSVKNLLPPRERTYENYGADHGSNSRGMCRFVTCNVSISNPFYHIGGGALQ